MPLKDLIIVSFTVSMIPDCTFFDLVTLLTNTGIESLQNLSELMLDGISYLTKTSQVFFLST